MTTLSTTSVILSLQYDKVLFQVDEATAEYLKKYNINIKSMEKPTGTSHCVSAKLCSDDLCKAHNLISKSQLKVGQLYHLIYEIFPFEYAGKSGNSCRAYITRHEPKTHTLPDNVLALL